MTRFSSGSTAELLLPPSNTGGGSLGTPAHGAAHQKESLMSEWLSTVVIGGTFLLLGLAKCAGLALGIEGGRGKSIGRRLCGT